MFENVIKKHTFSAVLNMQIYTTLVATFASVINLFASGEWKPLKHGMDMFQSGQFSYLMTLVWSFHCLGRSFSLGMVGFLTSCVIKSLIIFIIPPNQALIQ
jgi:hypothetical protein